MYFFSVSMPALPIFFEDYSKRCGSRIEMNSEVNHPSVTVFSNMNEEFLHDKPAAL